jgi:hypothetical protein
MATLTEEEKAEVAANWDHLARLKFSPVLPRAFTEHGAIMAANVLNNRATPCRQFAHEPVSTPFPSLSPPPFRALCFRREYATCSRSGELWLNGLCSPTGI